MLMVALGLMALVHCLDTSESIHWPAGTYGIPKPTSGCPQTDGFQWKTGWRSQDTNGINSNNSKSQEFHLDGTVDNTKVNRSFCIKKDTKFDSVRPPWPQSQYCIYKSGQCPAGITNGGFVYWDDENENNSNAKGGTLPGGVSKYKINTAIRFCCKTDGDKNEPVLLPTETPFFLLAYGSAKCQMVKWAIASLEWIHYDTEHDDNKDNGGAVFPYNAGKTHPTIYYCYYLGCNETLTAISGTFHSPNYPRKYPDGQYCSWRITVSSAQRIHLTFTIFSLQSENNTDGLYVYDGENVTGEVLGVFYGGHPPPEEGIYSSSNHMFVIFKSDNNTSYTGFSALYCEDKCPETPTTAATTTTQIPEITTVSTAEPTPASKGGAKKDEREQPKEKGVNVVAVVVPIVVLVFIVSLLLAGFVYCKRRKTKKENKGIPSEVIYARSMEEPPPSVDNPYYDRGLTIANRECASEPNELYTEITLNTLNTKEAYKQPDDQYQSLYESVGAEAVCNPIYDSTT